MARQLGVMLCILLFGVDKVRCSLGFRVAASAAAAAAAMTRQLAIV